MTQLTTQQGKKYPYEKRLEVAQKYMVLGNLRLVADLAGVPYQTVRLWKTQEWWRDLVAEIRATRNISLDNKMSRIVDKSLEMVEDRLEHGEMYYDVKSGDWARRPVNLQGALKATDVLLNQQNILAKKEQVDTSAAQAATVADQIKNLAVEFAKFNTKRTVEVVNVEDAVYAVHDERTSGLQEATEVRWEAGSDQEEGPAERGSELDDEGGEGTQGGWEGRGSHDSTLEGGSPDESDEPASSYSPRQSFVR